MKDDRILEVELIYKICAKMARIRGGRAPNPDTVKLVLDATKECITESLENYERVILTNFGAFDQKLKQARGGASRFTPEFTFTPDMVDMLGSELIDLTTPEIQDIEDALETEQAVPDDEDSETPPTTNEVEVPPLVSQPRSLRDLLKSNNNLTTSFGRKN